MDEIAKEYDVIVLGTGMFNPNQAWELPFLPTLSLSFLSPCSYLLTPISSHLGLTECILSGYANRLRDCA